jgi:hypothetical protein
MQPDKCFATGHAYTKLCTKNYFVVLCVLSAFVAKNTTKHCALCTMRQLIHYGYSLKDNSSFVTRKYFPLDLLNLLSVL